MEWLPWCYRVAQTCLVPAEAPVYLKKDFIAYFQRRVPRLQNGFTEVCRMFLLLIRDYKIFTNESKAKEVGNVIFDQLSLKLAILVL